MTASIQDTWELEATATRRRLIGLGLDIHDGPLQDMNALRIDLHLFRSQMAQVVDVDGDGDGARLLARVSDLTARLESAEQELRRVASLAGSSALLDGGFTDAIRHMAAEHGRNCAFAFALDSTVDQLPLDDEVRIALLRVIQAAVGNIAQHSGAGHGSIAARRDGGFIELLIEDDGCGFDVASREAAAAEESHLGLFGMRRRVADLGGRLHIQSSLGRGTRISARTPATSGETGST